MHCSGGGGGGGDPGFWERGGLRNIFTTGGGYGTNGRGHSPSRDSKGVWGSADSSPSGVWAQPLFCFCIYLHEIHSSDAAASTDRP